MPPLLLPLLLPLLFLYSIPPFPLPFTSPGPFSHLARCLPKLPKWKTLKNNFQVTSRCDSICKLNFPFCLSTHTFCSVNYNSNSIPLFTWPVLLLHSLPSCDTCTTVATFTLALSIAMIKVHHSHYKLTPSPGQLFAPNCAAVDISLATFAPNFMCIRMQRKKHPRRNRCNLVMRRASTFGRRMFRGRFTYFLSFRLSLPSLAGRKWSCVAHQVQHRGWPLLETIQEQLPTSASWQKEHQFIYSTRLLFSMSEASSSTNSWLLVVEMVLLFFCKANNLVIWASLRKDDLPLTRA